MSIQISGKQMDIGESLTHQIELKISDSVDKYFGRGFSGTVVIEKHKNGFTTDCKIHLDSGITLQTKAQDSDPTLSFDKAFEKIEKRLRRYTRRLKAHNSESSPMESLSSASYRVVDTQSDSELDDTLSPAIIAESSHSVPTMVVASAVMHLELTEEPVLVFKNADGGRINVVYWRKDGNIGWIDTMGTMNTT